MTTAMRQQPASALRDLDAHTQPRLIRHHRRARHVYYVFHRGSPKQPPLACSRCHRRGPVHGHHGHLHHRRRVAEDAARPRLHPSGTELGLQRLRRRVRRPAAARRATLGPVRRPSHLHPRLGHPRRRLPDGRVRRQRARRARRPRRPGCWVRAHRTGRADAAVHDLRLLTQGAHQGVGALRRRSTRRRHRRRLPRRRPHRVRLLAVGVLHQRPPRRHRHRAHPLGDAGRHDPSRLPGHHQRRHRDRRTRSGRVRGRARPSGGMDLSLDTGRRTRWTGAAGAVRPHAGATA